MFFHSSKVFPFSDLASIEHLSLAFVKVDKGVDVINLEIGSTHIFSEIYNTVLTLTKDLTDIEDKTANTFKLWLLLNIFLNSALSI